MLARLVINWVVVGKLYLGRSVRYFSKVIVVGRGGCGSVGGGRGCMLDVVWDLGFLE